MKTIAKLAVVAMSAFFLVACNGNDSNKKSMEQGNQVQHTKHQRGNSDNQSTSNSRKTFAGGQHTQIMNS